MQGEEVTFYCSNCQQRVYTTIKEDGFICCDYCGFIPKAKHTTLSMSERWKRVGELLSNDSECSSLLEILTEQYGNCINQIYSGHMSRRDIVAFDDVWNGLSDIGSYLMFSPEFRCSEVTDEKGLERKNHYVNSKGLKIDCYNLSQFITPNVNGSAVIDMVSNRAEQYAVKYGMQYYDPSFNLDEFMENVTDQIERKIISLLYAGYGKRDIEKILCLTESKLQTMIKRIGEHLLNPLDLSGTNVKQCSRCKGYKLTSEFGKNDRSPDGLQYVCRACERARKHKNKISEGNNAKNGL